MIVGENDCGRGEHAGVASAAKRARGEQRISPGKWGFAADGETSRGEMGGALASPMIPSRSSAELAPVPKIVSRRRHLR